MTRIPRIALTPGEPAGIGPDLCISLAQRAQAAEIVLIADPDLLMARAALLGLPLRLHSYDPHQPPRIHAAGEVSIVPVPLPVPCTCGRAEPSNARYVLDTLDRAIDGCIAGEFAALVTGPIHKGVINDAGIPFSGHTEYLAARTHTPEPVMLLATPQMRVALVTTHLPLAAVSTAITRERVTRVLEVLHRELIAQFGIGSPRILVCGLNPHAGEGGHLGREEIDVIAPALAALQARGLRIEGPLPADTVFTPPFLQRADVVLAMYHDQGLPVLKHAGFGTAVNITLGLPFVRTSVDHGTALDLAGSGTAAVGSLQAALNMAVEISARRSA